jgi:hypothetical protein
MLISTDGRLSTPSGQLKRPLADIHASKSRHGPELIGERLKPSTLQADRVTDVC